MSDSSKGIIRTFTSWFRRVFARPLNELSRTGRVAQNLYDVAQLQKQQRKFYREMGEIAMDLVDQGELKNLRMQQITAKIKRTKRLLGRQELLLKSMQDRGSLNEALKLDDQINKDSLEPV